MNKWFKAVGICISILMAESALAQGTTTPSAPTIKLKCAALKPGTVKKAIIATIVDKAKTACPTCKRIKVRVALTYPKQEPTQIQSDRLYDNFEQPSVCSGDAWQVGPVCLQSVTTDTTAVLKLVAPAEGTGYIGSSCEIEGVKAKITLTYLNASNQKESKQLSSVIDLGGVFQ